jgi:hypothetical protein
MSMGDGKASNLIDYLDNLIDKGKATKGAIDPIRVAFRRVLQVVEGDNWENIEVKDIDIKDYMARFSNLTMGKYSPDSLTTYKSRITRGINWYIKFLQIPGWTPDLQKRNPPTRIQPPQSKKNSHTSHPTKTSIQVQNSNSTQAMPSVANDPSRILYPYPLSDGQLVHISLPVRLSKIDAKRIAAFVESIAVDEPVKNEVPKDASS